MNCLTSILDDPDHEIDGNFNSEAKCLEFNHICLSGISAHQLDWLLQLISKTNGSNQLEKVKFDVWVPKDSDIINWPAWKIMDRFLAGTHFECLQQLDVTLYVTDSCVEIPDYMAVMLPLLSEKDVVVHGAAVVNVCI